MQSVKLGIIQERKNPPDTRVPLTPQQCRQLLHQYPHVQLVVEQSPNRCYTDAEYKQAGIKLVDDVADCDILLGVKEVPKAEILPGKTYLIFSHTHKKQPYNRELLRTFVQRNNRLVDYELLTNEQGIRVIAFGRFAGLVGAHNALLTWGKRTGKLSLERATGYTDLAAMLQSYQGLQIPPVKIVLTGDGRVARGAREILDAMGIKRLSPAEYLATDQPTEAVYVQLDSIDLYSRTDGSPFEAQHFFSQPEMYQSSFGPYTTCTDVMINAIYWNPAAPVYFNREDMRQPNFSITTIADITCDIEGSVPATLRATTIAEPFMGYNPATGQEEAPFQPHVVDIMSIDNLPNELPRDASAAFGEQLLTFVIPQLLGTTPGNMIEKASITENGQLGKHFSYLAGFLAEA